MIIKTIWCVRMLIYKWWHFIWINKFIINIILIMMTFKIYILKICRKLLKLRHFLFIRIIVVTLIWRHLILNPLVIQFKLIFLINIIIIFYISFLCKSSMICIGWYLLFIKLLFGSWILYIFIPITILRFFT